MTREDAVKALEIELNQWDADCKSYHAVKEALPMAIDALKYAHSCRLTDDHICHFPWLSCDVCEVTHKALGLVKIDRVLEIIDDETIDEDNGRMIDQGIVWLNAKMLKQRIEILRGDME